MLVELAIGDAYGAGFEYVRDRKFINANNDLSGYVKHPRHGGKPGTYTDDTQMSVAITELILDEKDWSPENIASYFVDAFHRDKRTGYAGGFHSFLKHTKTGADFIQNIRATSDKSGAAMRACPIGIYPTISDVVSRCSKQAVVTHNTPDGINAAVAASLMTHYFLYQLGSKSDLPAFLKEHVPGNWDQPWVGQVGSRGWMSVRAALTSLMKNDNLSALLRSSVAWGGDTDTVATIALAAGSCCREIKKNLPPVLEKKIENGPYGMAYLKKLDQRLMKLKVRLEDINKGREKRSNGLFF